MYREHVEKLRIQVQSLQKEITDMVITNENEKKLRMSLQMEYEEKLGNMKDDFQVTRGELNTMLEQKIDFLGSMISLEKQEVLAKQAEVREELIERNVSKKMNAISMQLRCLWNAPL